MKALIKVGTVVLGGAVLLWQYYDTQYYIDRILHTQVDIMRTQIQLVEAVKEVNPNFAPSLPHRMPASPDGNIRVIHTNQQIKYNERDLFCMAKNIYHEAGNEPMIGRYAVAQVTLNRKADSRYPKNVCDVVFDPFQFSWANNKKIRYTLPNDPSWESAWRIANDVVVKGYRVQGLETSLFYHADYVAPYWKDPSSKVGQIGRHIFYTRAR